MKIGCHTLQWGMGIDESTRYTWDGRVWQTTLAEAVSDISKLGYSGFECSESDLPLFFSKPEEFKEITARHNLRFVSVWNTLLPKHLDAGYRPAVDPTLPMNDPRQFRGICIEDITEDDVKTDFENKVRYAEGVSSLGGECITYGGPFILERDVKEDHFRLVGEYLTNLGERLRSMQVRLAYHVHLSTLVQNAKDVERLYQYADKSIVGLCLDTAHLTAAGDDVVRVVKKYLPRLTHMHLKDEVGGKFVELGKGRVDISGTIRTLVGGGYGHWAIVELDIPGDSPYESALVSKAYIDSVLNSIV